MKKLLAIALLASGLMISARTSAQNEDKSKWARAVWKITVVKQSANKVMDSNGLYLVPSAMEETWIPLWKWCRMMK